MVKHKLNKEFVFFIVLIIASIITYIIVCKIDNKENFYDGCGSNKCICSKMDQKVCMNRNIVSSNYDSGLITENNFYLK